MPEEKVSDSPQQSRKQAFLAEAKAAVVPVAAAFWTAIGTFWTIFAWYHQEIVVPSTAPVNITTEVNLEDAGPVGRPNAQPSSQFEAIQISVTATNVSGRNVYILSNYWDAWGINVMFPEKPDENQQWLRDQNELEELQSASGEFSYSISGKYYKISAFERVGWGHLFPNTYFLYPKESISSSVIFFVPKGGYDLIHAEIHIPTTSKPNSVQVDFLIDEKTLKSKFFTIGKDGARKEVTDPADIKALPIQEFESRTQLSLWRTDMQVSAKAATSKVPNP